MHESYTPFDIETEDLDTIIVFTFHCFFASIELLAFVDIFTTRVTAPIWVVKPRELETVEEPQTLKTGP